MFQYFQSFQLLIVSWARKVNNYFVAPLSDFIIINNNYFPSNNFQVPAGKTWIISNEEYDNIKIDSNKSFKESRGAGEILLRIKTFKTEYLWQRLFILLWNIKQILHRKQKTVVPLIHTVLCRLVSCRPSTIEGSRTIFW